MGEGDEDILSLREKSSWSASCIGREMVMHGDACCRGEVSVSGSRGGQRKL